MVSEEMADRILAIAEALNYRRNPLAAGLKTQHSYTVGVVVPDLTNPVFPPVVRAVERVLAKEGYVTMLTDSDNSRDMERTILASLRSRQVDGLILATALLNDEIIAECREHKTPIVLVNRTVADESIPSVVTNDLYGIRLAVEHLLHLGHRKIAYVGGPSNTSTGRDRRQGFLAAVEEYRLKADPKLIADAPSFTIGAGRDALRLILQSKRAFTAVVAANDMLALGCYDALAEANLKCPGDISVTGYNDMPFADRFTPPLTTLHIPHEEMGAQAAQLLLRRMRDADTKAGSLHLDPALVVRGSTAKLSR